MTLGKTSARMTSVQLEISDLLWPSSELTSTEAASSLARLRRQILPDGLPEPANTSRTVSLRPMVWKLLLGVNELPVEEYLDLVQRGPSVANDKIRNDTFRTMATDTEFKRRVKEDMLVRLLDAIVWKYQLDTDMVDFDYVQGMNVLAAPLLYTMPSEIEAYQCFSSILRRKCPLYVQKTMEGVHRGLKLLDLCLAVLDEELFKYLMDKGLKAEIYAFPSLLTWSACTPPLQECVKLWDFLLAFGVHLNVLCVIAQLHLIRHELLEQPNPNKLLRNLPPLDSSSLISLSCRFVTRLPRDLYDKLARHPWDPTLQL